MKWSTYIGLFGVIFAAGIILGLVAFVTNEHKNTIEEGFSHERILIVDNSKTISFMNSNEHPAYAICRIS
ncbi:hypothetical protein [Lentibacillus amyloliquefaciens]|uniref:Uncharacterized protein n=1 Tax=Lentibacillus amyloliquefaciens TaxID=1472767 RepID=A0A0U4E1Z5_9BACI|nr:hypothetical protein [Lentibacillus amyloliquefaciens]ALX47260.1 hypothetical protein AOX59_00780 [Lentibacillus amyloliquefaciens]